MTVKCWQFNQSKSDLLAIYSVLYIAFLGFVCQLSNLKSTHGIPIIDKQIPDFVVGKWKCLNSELVTIHDYWITIDSLTAEINTAKWNKIKIKNLVQVGKEVFQWFIIKLEGNFFFFLLILEAGLKLAWYKGWAFNTC